MITTDLQPLSIIEDNGFVALLKFLDPKYQLPSRKIFKKWLENKYEEATSNVKNELANVRKVCITTDTWTSVNMDSFLTVTCHFINDIYQIKTYVLETVKIEGSHTGAAIANNLQSIFNNWKIEDKVISIVTDNAANIKFAIKQLEPRTTNILCFAHTG